MFVSRDSSVGIATDYGLTAVVQFPTGARDFIPLHSVQIGSGPHPASFPMGARGVKRPWCKAEHSPLPSVKVKNGEAIPPLPHISSWRVA
jgi:hypothetical protein